MDPIQNPYAPGAGTQPPYLVGRDEVRESARIALGRIGAGHSSQSILMIGLRGVGKTVLLDRIRRDAEKNGVYVAWIEVPENRSLPSLLAPQLRNILLKLSRREKAKALAQRALRGLAGFVNALQMTYQDIVEFGLKFDVEPGLADNGNLEVDLQDLMEAVGVAAKAAEGCVVFFVDELQYMKGQEFAALITALHRTSQRQLPVTMIGAGLPQLRGLAGKAKSYAERLLAITEISSLSPMDARSAIEKPARDAGVVIASDALDAIVSGTQCYPYFLQVWGKHVWDVAEDSPITVSDVEIASEEAISDLDESFFRVRFERLTPGERKYLRAMADLGEGPHRSGDIAGVLGREVTSVAPVRSQLINKGMIWSPSHGDTAFTVPLFHEFMVRIMPDHDRYATDDRNLS